MEKISLVLFFILFNYVSFSQTSIKGSVSNDNNIPIPYVSILLKEVGSNIIDSYTYSKDNGTYVITTQLENEFTLTFSALGYKEQTFKIIISADNTVVDKSIVMEEESISLNEVIINSEKSIKVKEDTITFKASKFADGNEDIVEDLLKKIPGISVGDNGTIKIGNKEIEKLMIDGDDFFAKGYKLLSKNMPAYPIHEIEVLQNYSNNRLLKNIEESDKVALNLKLKNKMKRLWFGNVQASIGNDSFYHIKSNLMNFGKRNKYFVFSNFNNTGFDSTGDINNLIRPTSTDDISTIGDNHSVNDVINLSRGNLNFKQNRTNFNNSELASLNAILKPTEKLKIKTLGFFNWDETDFFRNSTDVVAVNGTNFINTEDYQLKNNKRIAFGKLDVNYNISETKMLETATKFNNGSFHDSSNLIFNGNSTIENLQHQNTLLDQKVNYTNKFNEKKVFLLTGRFIDEKTPQNYAVNQFFYQDLFPAIANVDNVNQESTNQMKFVGLNAHLLDRKINGHFLELQLGNAFRKDRLITRFSLLEDNTVLAQPKGYQNQTNYQVNDLYLKSKYRLKFRDFGIVGTLDVHQLFNGLENNNVNTTQNPFFVNPSLGFDWKINDKNKITSTYSYNTKNGKILDVYSDFILTGYRTFLKGADSFNQLSASLVVFNYELGNWSDRFFVNTFLIYNTNHDFFSTNTFISQNYTQSEKILIKDREFITLNSKLDYYFKFIASNLKLDLGYTANEYKNIVNNSDLRQVKSKNYNYGIELRSGFKGVFNYHLGTKWTKREIKTSVNKSFTDNVSFLDLSFIFNKKLDFQVQAERYFFGYLKTDNTYDFLDFDARYKLIENKLTLGISGKNLFNTETFRNFSISDIGTSTAEYRLLPRFVLLKMEYRF